MSTLSTIERLVSQSTKGNEDFAAESIVDALIAAAEKKNKMAVFFLKEVKEGRA